MTKLVILKNVKSVGDGTLVSIPDATELTGRRSVQAVVEGPLPVSAQIKLYGCNDGRFPLEIATFDLSSATETVVVELHPDDTPCEFYTSKVVSLSAGSKVSLIASV